MTTQEHEAAGLDMKTIIADSLMRLTLISTGMVLDNVLIGGTWNRGMIGGTVAVVGLSPFKLGQQIRWPYDPDDWAETEESELAASLSGELPF